MHQTAIHRRLPRAGIDPIDDAATAFAMLSLAVHHPLRHETIVVLLDDARRGRSIVVVSGTVEPDSVVEVVELLTGSPSCDEIGGIVVATVRPDPASSPANTDADIDRWLEMSHIAADAGVELLEWFVIGRTISCPRDRLGEPPRW